MKYKKISFALVTIGLICTYLCEGSFSILSEPRQSCAGYDGIANAIAALTESVSGQTQQVDPLLVLQSKLTDLLKSVRIYKSCDDVTGPPGLYRVRDGIVPRYFFCETQVQGGRWTVIQRRIEGKLNFTRSFTEYTGGFGHPNNEFWIGLTRINGITSQSQHELMIYMEAFDGANATVRYTDFKIGNLSDNFRLTSLGNYSGTLTANSFSTSLNKSFSTFDKDQDTSNTTNCARVWGGGWWFNNCGDSNLNGFYRGPTPTTTPKTSMTWAAFKGNSQPLKASIMMIRKFIP
ncbi:angiopoietin-related protein 6-like [Anopheles bellator]|uniref:angiopoietin-related protein 6-like n=1 Tax=Anopheles bellator TaxID=139047 RepID=UPI0026487819|nr:angiopoietin-related protein 6-like [Anopheles bellator]